MDNFIKFLNKVRGRLLIKSKDIVRIEKFNTILWLKLRTYVKNLYLTYKF